MNEKLIIRMTRPLEPFDASDPQIVQAAQALGVSVEKLEQIATREVGRVIAQAKDPQHGAQVTKILATIGVQVRVEADPVKTDPVKTDPVKTEPVKTDPVKVVPQTVSPAMQQAITQPRSASKASSIEAAANSNFADQNAVNPNPTSPNLTSPNPVPAVPAFAPIRSQAGAAAIAEARPAMAAAEVADDPFAPIQRSETMLESRHEIEDRHDQPQAIAAVEASAPGRRSSLRNRMIGAFLIPVLGLGIAIGAYIMVALPGVVTRSLESRAFAASYAAGRLMVKDAVQLPDMSALSNLNRSSRELLSSTQDAAFIAVLPEGSDPIISSELNLDSEATAVTLGEQLGTYSSNGGIGTFDAGGQTFTVAASPIQTASEGSTSLGTVVVALKRDAIASEVMRALVPFSIALLVALGATAALGFRLSGTLISPIMKATDLSNRISMGDLDLEVKAERNDEIGDLLGSLERMRVSLKMLLNQPT